VLLFYLSKIFAEDAETATRSSRLEPVAVQRHDTRSLGADDAREVVVRLDPLENQMW
jgi:hypothetical protein